MCRLGAAGPAYELPHVQLQHSDRVANNMVTTVSASSAEVATGTFSKEKIAATLEALAADGVVGIGRAISLEHIDALAEKMLADLEAFDASPRGPIVNHWQGLRCVCILG